MGFDTEVAADVGTRSYLQRLCMFVDRAEVTFHAGKGGDGCTSMRREKYVPRGGPDGGDGGHGSSIRLEARHGVDSLSTFAGRSIVRAKDGSPGQGSMRHGRTARDVTILVPPGTTVIDPAGDFVIKDLRRDGEAVVIARGGRGGRGHAHFKSATDRAPRQRTLGEPGESRRVVLELKSIADVGLVGRPNAGKSTFLAAVTAARPEIADYPFTTKHPNLGIVDLAGGRSFVLADIPGLIEGAAEGVGLGHEFLRHVQRAGVLIHLVEPAPTDGTDPIQNYDRIREELRRYDASLSDRGEVVAVTKGELDVAPEVSETLRGHTGGGVFRISSVTGEGLTELLDEVYRCVARRRAAAAEADPAAGPADEAAERTTQRPRRVPPHKAGPTAALSDAMQAKDYVDDAADG